MVPAPGQGALAIEAREGDTAVVKLLEPLNDQQTVAAVTAERNLLTALGGGCQVPVGAYARHVDGELRLISTVCHPDGALRIFESAVGKPVGAGLPSPYDLAKTVAKKLQNNGATELLMMAQRALQ